MGHEPLKCWGIIIPAMLHRNLPLPEAACHPSAAEYTVSAGIAAFGVLLGYLLIRLPSADLIFSQPRQSPDAGEITKEQGRARMAAYLKKVGRGARGTWPSREEMGKVKEKTWAGVKEGKLTEAHAKERREGYLNRFRREGVAGRYKRKGISDILFGVVKRRNTTFAELAPQIAMVASTASSAGVGLDELGAALGTLARAGVRTGNPVTAVNQIILSFLKPSEEAAEYARQGGFSHILESKKGPDIGRGSRRPILS